MKQIEDKKIIIILIVVTIAFFVFTLVRKQIKLSEFSIANNSDNSVFKSYLGSKDIVNKYYNDYINIALSNKEEAYRMLDDNYKTKTNMSYSEFQEKMRELENKEYYKYSIKSYRIDENEDYILYLVKNEIGDKFAFKVTGIMDYTVYLDFDTLK